MANKNYSYDVQLFYEGTNTWLSGPIIAQAKSISFCRGFMACLMEFNVCPKCRIIDRFTKEIIEEYSGHERRMHVNSPEVPPNGK